MRREVWLVVSSPLRGQLNEKRWASEGECVEALGLSHTVLTRLRASGDLVAGDHWIWIGGQRNGKVGYDLDRIETWQRERTAKIVRDLEAAK